MNEKNTKRLIIRFSCSDTAGVPWIPCAGAAVDEDALDVGFPEQAAIIRAAQRGEAPAALVKQAVDGGRADAAFKLLFRDPQSAAGAAAQRGVPVFPDGCERGVIARAEGMLECADGGAAM